MDINNDIKNKKEEKNQTGIIFDLSFDLFKEYVRFLDELIKIII